MAEESSGAYCYYLKRKEVISVFIIVGYMAVSMYADICIQATVGVASSKNATEYDVVNRGVFTDGNIDKAVEQLQKEYPDAVVIRR